MNRLSFRNTAPITREEIDKDKSRPWSGTPRLKWSESRSVVSDPLPPHELYSPRNSLGRNTGVGSFSLLQGIFPVKGSNSGLLHCRQIFHQLSLQGNPRILKWVAYPFSSRSSWPRNRTGISWIADGFFTSWDTKEVLSLRDDACEMLSLCGSVHHCPWFLLIWCVVSIAGRYVLNMIEQRWQVWGENQL